MSSAGESESDRTGGAAEFAEVEQLLSAARSGIRRLTPDQAIAAVGQGALIVDIRPAWQRAYEGEIAGALIVERNHLEWRLHPGSAVRLVFAVPGQRWIVACSEGYTSSLAAAALCSLGVPASDLIGGVSGWRAAGLPLVDGPTRTERISGSEPPLKAGDLGAPTGRDEPAH
ncbi:MAG: rhodanese-like domain-containing protein [Actinomycetota bacterium]|nr:rhodanese-like domain-containing protein [Actinomycetota bacterium]MDQ2958338.1 rhodanese-like domain-containing protein [Actinomycetota bacterium]